jgi:2-haloacid dehalogenase
MITQSLELSPIYVFDAYGTLFDVHSAVSRYRDEVGPKSDLLSAIWRAKQLEYTWNGQCRLRF